MKTKLNKFTYMVNRKSFIFVETIYILVFKAAISTWI